MFEQYHFGTQCRINVESSELVSLYGLRACLVTYSKNYYCSLGQQVLYLEDSIKPLYDEYGVTSWEELRDLNLPAVDGRRDIDILEDVSFAGFFDDVLNGFSFVDKKKDLYVVGTKEDKEWLGSVQEYLDDMDDEDFFSQYEDDFTDDAMNLYCWNEQFAWHDIPYSAESGKQGIMNCWGEKLSPACFDECRPGCVVTSKAVPAKQNGKWALVDREQQGKPLTPFVYDSIEEWLGDVFTMSRGNHFGISDGNGTEIIPTEMDDISEAGKDNIYLTKRQGKFGFHFSNGVDIAPCVDEIVRSEDSSPLKFRIGTDWKYLSEEGNFTDSADNDTLRGCALCFTGRISHKNMLEADQASLYSLLFQYS